MQSPHQPSFAGIREWIERRPSAWISLFLASPLLLLLTTGLVLFRGQTTTTAGTATSTVVMPLEVIGVAPTAVSVTVDINDPTGIDSLYLKGHSLGYHKSEYADQNGYDQKASFRINGGPWIPISNRTSTCRYPEKLYAIDHPNTTAGCIGGPLHTLRLRVDATASGGWTQGTNTIDFRFQRSEGVSSGYRILELDVLSGNSSRIGSTTFTMDQPSTWDAPSGYSSAVSEGKALWSKRNSLKASSLSGAEDIVAACADCHARDGRDLKYFNYSNESIVARSEFHGLSEAAGKKIAAYIRSVDLNLPNGYDVESCEARPWNPPYQPGPGLDSKPVECWAAGAGLEWVLDSEREDPGTERDMITHMFPQGLNGTAALHETHPDSTLNVREIPEAYQFPDWNQWLPDVHPLDWIGQSEIENSTWMTEMNDLNAKLASNRQAEIDGIKFWDDPNRLKFWFGAMSEMSEVAYKGISQFFDKNGLSKPSSYGDDYIERLSLMQVITVNLWYVNTKYQLEDLGTEVFINNDAGVNAGMDDREWFYPATRAVYEVSPHKNSRPGYVSEGPYADAKQNKHFGSAWYRVALVLGGGGHRSQAGHHPFDWNYQFPHIGENSESYNHPQPLAYFKSHFLSIQAEHNSYSAEDRIGFDLANNQPFRVRWEHHGPINWMMGTLDPNLRRRLDEAAARAWVISAERFSASDFPRGSGTYYKTESYALPSDPSSTEVGHRDPYPDHMYAYTERLASSGVSGPVVDRMARWGEMLWPKGNWEQWMLSQASQSIPLDRGWNLISSRVRPKPTSMRDVFSDVERDLAIVQNESGDSYDPTQQTNTLDSWTYTEGYRVYMNDKQTLSVTGTGLNSPTLSLTKGWNLVPYYPSNEMAVEDALAPIKDEVQIVKDGAGNSYIPSRNVNEIGMLQPGQAYKVYVTNSTSFSYP